MQGVIAMEVRDGEAFLIRNEAYVSICQVVQQVKVD